MLRKVGVLISLVATLLSGSMALGATQTHRESIRVQGPHLKTLPEDTDALVGTGDFVGGKGWYAYRPINLSDVEQAFQARGHHQVCRRLRAWRDQVLSEHYRPRVQRKLAREAFSMACRP